MKYFWHPFLGKHGIYWTFVCQYQTFLIFLKFTNLEEDALVEFMVSRLTFVFCNVIWKYLLIKVTSIFFKESYQLFPVSDVRYIFKEEIKNWLKTERNPVTYFCHFYLFSVIICYDKWGIWESPMKIEKAGVCWRCLLQSHQTGPWLQLCTTAVGNQTWAPVL